MKNNTKIILVKKSSVFRVKQNQQVIFVALILGNKKLSIQFNVEEGSFYKFLCLFIGTANDQINVSVIARHFKNNSMGEIVIRGVLTDDARCKISGLIKMEKSINNSSGLFSHRTLLLSKSAAVESQPHLEIASQNIQAKHEVTISRLDEEQLFYLMSRGIEKDEASKMIIRGMFSKEQPFLPTNLQIDLQTKLQILV